MKKILMVLVLGLFGMLWTATAQCWDNPCQNETVLNGIITDQSFNGSQCFTGSAVINNSVNFNNWQYLSFSGSYAIHQTLNLNNRSNIYIYGSGTLNNVSMSGGDTIFVDGALVINNIVSNNSNQGGRNVIYISATSSLVIAGNTYTTGTINLQNNNPSNELDIKVCEGSALPVTFDGLAFSGTSLTWSMGDQSNVDHFDIEGSNNGMAFKYVRSIPPNHDHQYSVDLTSYLVFGSLLFLPLAVGKRRKFGIVLGLALIIGAVACSKSDVNPTGVHYKMWRVAAITNVGDTVYSSITHR